jgi:LmbE family N-acetylglucosaminyl deacetylase
MSQLSILAAYGHPDDEGQVTGTLARFVEAGAKVTLVCGTRGEVGEISDPLLATPETLRYVRELELRAAMAQIRLWDVRFLPFRDSGMAGTPENDDPRCLHRQDADVVVNHLVTIMREVQPHVVFTWDPNGGYGHPDHIAMHKHTLAAFDAASDSAKFPNAGRPWAPKRLYWGAFTMKRFAKMWMEMESRGMLPEPMDEERRKRFEEAMQQPDPPVSLVHPCLDLAEKKQTASRMHRSQFGENSMVNRIPEDMRKAFYGQEQFFQARPEWSGDEPEQGLEGLFALA